MWQIGREACLREQIDDAETVEEKMLKRQECKRELAGSLVTTESGFFK